MGQPRKSVLKYLFITAKTDYSEESIFKPEAEMEKYVGTLFGWFETGTEGAIWALQEDGQGGYDGLKIIKPGDHLTIFGEHQEILFDGTIIPDYKVGWTEYPLGPGRGQPAALGFWIHWTQAGFRPDDWAKFFLREELKLPPLRAELIR